MKIWTPGKVERLRFKGALAGGTFVSKDVIADNGGIVLPFEADFTAPSTRPTLCTGAVETWWYLRPWWACGVCSNWMTDYCAG